MILSLLTPSWAGEADVDFLVGFRTSPEASIAQPSDWEPEFEPSAVVAVLGRLQTAAGPVWLGLDAGAWGLGPEPDASVLSLGPRAGVSGGNRVRGELAARYDAQLFPASVPTTNGRAEGLARATLTGRVAEPFVAVEGVDREYVQDGWSFRTVAPELGVSLHASGGPRARFGVGGQANQGSPSRTGARAPVGGQGRGTVELGWSAARWDVWTRYRLIAAEGGEPQGAALPVFTPVGDYSDDVDALSAGGFLQHRLEAGFSVDRRPWTLRGAVLGRVRASEADDGASFRRTAHGQLAVERRLSDAWSGTATVGCSGAELVTGQGYLDVYGWAGLSWHGPTAAPAP